MTGRDSRTEGVPHLVRTFYRQWKIAFMWSLHSPAREPGKHQAEPGVRRGNRAVEPV
jgi:hypothetical protein